MIAIEFNQPDVTLTGKDDRKTILLAELIIRREHKSGQPVTIGRIFGSGSAASAASEHLGRLATELRLGFMPETIDVGRVVRDIVELPDEMALSIVDTVVEPLAIPLVGKVPSDPDPRVPSEPKPDKRRRRPARGRRYLDRLSAYAQPKPKPKAPAEENPVDLLPKRRWGRRRRQ